MISMDLTQIVKVQRVSGGRSGRRDYGRLYTLDDGIKVYLAKRSRKEIFLCGKKTLSDAIRDRVAEWALDDETILRLRMEMVDYIGVCENTTGNIWIAPIAVWLDRTNFTYRNYEQRGGSLQRYISHDLLEKVEGLKHLTTKIIDKKMKVTRLN